jgi:hypothetical protein
LKCAYDPASRRKIHLISADFCYGPFVEPTALPAE